MQDAVIGSSTCAEAVQREDGGRRRLPFHGASLSAAAWKAAGSIPLQRSAAEAGLSLNRALPAERNGFYRYMEAASRPVRVQRDLKLGGTTDLCSP